MGVVAHDLSRSVIPFNPGRQHVNLPSLRDLMFLRASLSPGDLYHHFLELCIHSLIRTETLQDMLVKFWQQCHISLTDTSTSKGTF